MQLFLNRILLNISDLQSTKSLFPDDVAKVIDSMAEVATVIGGLKTFASVSLAIVLVILVRCRVLPRLYKELLSQNSTKTKAELMWIKKKYVEHTLCDVNDTQGLEIKASVVLKEILCKKDYVVGIVGKAGLGKSEMLLWLYLKLAKSIHRRCAFIQIGADRFSSKELVRISIKRQLNTAKKFVPFCRAYIFIDAIDEASNLFGTQTSFDANFINELKDDIDILNCNIIFSIRNECFQRGISDIVENCRTGTSTPAIFKILPMNQQQIKNIYKSFRYAKRIEKRLSKRNSFNLRFQNTLPDTKVRKSIKAFERHINNHSDTIFKYPVFMRYANRLMEENDGTLDNLSLDNSLDAIGILVEKMIKWEFHAIYKTPAYLTDGKSKKPVYQRFEESMYKMIDLILEDMISDHEIKRTVNRDTVVIAYNLLFLSGGNEQDNPLQVAHCLFSWDIKETAFEFHNSILWDYFVSKYIGGSTVNYKVRKNMFNCQSKNTRLYQSVIEVYFQRLYKNLSAKDAKALLDNSEEEKQISIITLPGLCLTEFYKKLPLDDWSFMLPTGAVFKAETIIDIIENNKLELNAENTLGISSASDIRGLCTDSELNELTHIAFHELTEPGNKCVYIKPDAGELIDDEIKEMIQLCFPDFTDDRYEIKYIAVTPGNEGMAFEDIAELTDITFEESIDDDFDISYLFDLSNLQYVTLPPYHRAFLQLGKYNNSNERKLHLWHRTPYDRAERRFCDGKNSKDDIELLDIIFKLEIEDTEYMGLSKPEYQSTCWTALSLAEAYRDKASYLTKDEQYKVLSGVVNAINSNWGNKKLNYRYCYDYGVLLINRNKSARTTGIDWLLVPYNKTLDEVFVRFERYNLGCELVKAYAWDHNIEKGVSILNDIESKYRISETNTLYYRVRCALRLCELKKKYDSPTKALKKAALNALGDFSKSVGGNDALYCSYASEFYMIIGDYKNAKLVLDKLGNTLDKTNMRDEDDESYQGDWIKYHEMLLLYLYLTKDHNQATQTADKLRECKYRDDCLWINAYRYIKNKCEVALNLDVAIDETLLKDYDDFRRTSIWI